jgi:hypothetical protein
MSTNIEIKKTTDTDPIQIRILLAESNPTEIARTRSNIDREFQSGIKIANNYNELLEKIATEYPQLVVLGRIDKSNYFEICEECHKIQRDLQIVLISKQEIVNDSFRQSLKASGVIDIIPQDSERLNQLLRTLDKSVPQQATSKQKEIPTDKSVPQQATSKQKETPTDKSTHQQPASKPVEKPISGRMVLAALADIVITSNNFFGPLAQGNYWRKAHAGTVDKFPFIQNWSTDHFSKFSCDESILDRELTDEDIHSLRIWIQFFLEECDRIIVGFGEILNNSDLSPLAKYLLTKS